MVLRSILTFETVKEMLKMIQRKWELFSSIFLWCYVLCYIMLYIVILTESVDKTVKFAIQMKATQWAVLSYVAVYYAL